MIQDVSGMGFHCIQRCACRQKKMKNRKMIFNKLNTFFPQVNTNNPYTVKHQKEMKQILKNATDH